MKLQLPVWTIISPISAALAYGGYLLGFGGLYLIVLAIALFASVLAAVHHAEVVAHRVGEPFGTLVLAVAITIIEVALIVSIMLSSQSDTSSLARDTVFAAVMIILTGMVGLCLLIGGIRHKEQYFGIYGVSAALTTLTAIAVLTMVLPNYLTSMEGPSFTRSQLIFVAVVSLVLYLTFLLVQTVRHRDFFLPKVDEEKEDVHAPPPSSKTALMSLGLLMVCLVAVVLLAKTLSPSIELAIENAGAPKTLVGVIIALMVLLPEGLAAVKAASRNRLQTSLNLSLGSALACIGLTIPVVAIVSLATGMQLNMGVDAKSTILLILSLLTIILSLATGRTNILHGVVLLMLFFVYLFTTIVP